ncbi:unnamed protein product [Rotaria sordida]|uniref:Protein translocase subunit SecA n=1 Tax=Rotaria sordida TaxID=392033 RepID=A0A815RM39_9BILA|nr:unnamed protein product [Rotaria sordida]CAF1479426.1 unnamed protein product [Rotaria sordida]
MSFHEENLFKSICLKFFEFHKIGWTYEQKALLLFIIVDWTSSSAPSDRKLKLQHLLNIISDDTIVSLVSADQILNVIQTQPSTDWSSTLLSLVTYQIDNNFKFPDEWLKSYISPSPIDPISSNNDLINTTTEIERTRIRTDTERCLEQKESDLLRVSLQTIDSIPFHNFHYSPEPEPLEEYQSILNENLKELTYLKWPASDITSIKSVILNPHNFNNLDILKTSILLIETIVTNRLSESNTVKRIVKCLLAKPNNSRIWMEELQKIVKESGTGKSLQSLLEELISLNPNLTNHSDLKRIFQTVMNYHTNNVSHWTVHDIKNWSRTHSSTHSHPFSSDADCYKMAIIVRAACLHKQYLPRDIQILSVILMLTHNTPGGRIEQIKTGEGKSIIVCMLAAYLAVGKQGKKVDIITTSEVLAIRDTEEFKDFYDMFNLTCTHNCRDGRENDKTNYSLDIVYGTINHFAGDLLRTEFYLQNVRQNRPYDVAIVDEVDSMFIDQSNSYTQLASLTPGMKSLTIIFRLIWNCFSTYHISSTGRDNDEDNDCFVMKNEQNESCQINILTFIKKKLEDRNLLRYPNYRQQYIQSKLRAWIQSCKHAMYSMHENIDYVISDDGKIVVVDYQNTGVSQTNMHWNDGLHQFLQLKHNLRLSPERMCDSFFSNVTYFKKYQPNLYGVTGTIGTKASQDFVRDVYGVDVVFIPKYLDSDFRICPDQVAQSREQWLVKISAECHKIAIQKKRAVLIISQTIADAEDIAKKLKSSQHRNVKLYVRSDLKQHVKPEDIHEGDIIVATNLAGRGTDMKPVTAVNDRGGLHVIVTFLPRNLRIEQQAFGRAGRQGKPGSACLMIYQDMPPELYSFIDEAQLIERIKVARDKNEVKMIQQALSLVRKIEAKDQLLKQFLDLVHSERDSIDFGNNKTYRPGFDSMRETWANFCSKIDDLHNETEIQREYQTFANSIRTRLEQCLTLKRNVAPRYTLIPLNHQLVSIAVTDQEHEKQIAENDIEILNALIEYPKYLIDAGINELCGKKPSGARLRSLKLLQAAQQLDNTDFITYYNQIPSLIDQEKIADAKQAFTNALEHLEQEMHYREMLNIFNAVQPSDENKKEQQQPRSLAEILFLNIVKAYIQGAKDQLKKFDSDKHEIECKIEYWKEAVEEQLKSTKYAHLMAELEDERMEWAFEGLQFRYQFAITAKRSWWKTLFVFIIGIAQVVGGAILCYYGHVKFGTSMIGQGLVDVFTAVFTKITDDFSISDYLKNKIVSYGTQLFGLGMLDRFVTPLMSTQTINIIGFGVKTVHELATNGINLDSLKNVALAALQVAGVNGNSLKCVKTIMENTDTATALISGDFKQIMNVKTVNNFLQLFGGENALLKGKEKEILSRALNFSVDLSHFDINNPLSSAFKLVEKQIGSLPVTQLIIKNMIRNHFVVGSIVYFVFPLYVVII